jgi:hypothetical protein
MDARDGLTDITIKTINGKKRPAIALLITEEKRQFVIGFLLIPDVMVTPICPALTKIGRDNGLGCVRLHKRVYEKDNGNGSYVPAI